MEMLRWLLIWAAIFFPFAKGQMDAEKFSWDIELDYPVYPRLNFDSSNLESEIKFRYSYTGTYQQGVKYFQTSILAAGCLNGPAPIVPEALAIKQETIEPTTKKYSFDVDVVQTLIENSSYWSIAENSNIAEIKFCVRVDYLNNVESVNFFEADVTISVDLEAGFSPTNIITIRSNALGLDDLDAGADYGVVAYLCDILTGENIGDKPDYVQGDFMEICVRVEDPLVGAMYIESILDLTVFQLKNGSGEPAPPTYAIVEGNADELTTADCMKDGRCFIAHQLTSKFFDDEIPGTLEVRGTALLRFGTGSRRHLRRVPVRGLFEVTESGAISEFTLEANLLGDTDTTGTDEAKLEENKIAGFDTTLVVGAGAGAIGLIIGALAIYLVKGKKSSEKSGGNSPTIPKDIDATPAKDCKSTKSETSKPGHDAMLTATTAAEEESIEWEYGKCFQREQHKWSSVSNERPEGDYQLTFEPEDNEDDIVFEKNLLGGHVPRYKNNHKHKKGQHGHKGTGTRLSRNQNMDTCRPPPIHNTHFSPPTELCFENMSVSDDDEDWNWAGEDDYEEELVFDKHEKPETRPTRSLQRQTSDHSISSGSLGSSQSLGSQRSFIEIDPGSAPGDFESYAHSSLAESFEASFHDGGESIGGGSLAHSLGTLDLSLSGMSHGSLASLDMSTNCLYLGIGSDNAV